jgi:hypothetical protein
MRFADAVVAGGAALALLVACGAPAPRAGTTANQSGAEAAPAEPRVEPSAPTTPSSCDAYVAHYRRCEPVLQPAIMAGDRRSADAEEARVRYFEASAEAPSLPGACEAWDAELSASCP